MSKKLMTPFIVFSGGWGTKFSPLTTMMIIALPCCLLVVDPAFFLSYVPFCRYPLALHDPLSHGLRTRILFIVWPQLWERSPDIAVVCVSVSVLCKGISRLIQLFYLVCLLGSCWPADCKSVHYTMDPSGFANHIVQVCNFITCPMFFIEPDVTTRGI